MTPATISVILWVPFVVVLLLAAVKFCLKGYDTGIWHSLISLGATLVSALISFFVSKLLAGVLAKSLVPTIMETLLDPTTENGAVSGIVNLFLPNMVQAFLAIFLFGFIFFIMTIIVKVVAKKCSKSPDLNVEQKGLKWAGVGIRAVDAIIYTFLFFIPIYGTLGAYAPAVQTVISMTGEADEIVMAYLDAIAGHPLVAASNNTPIGAVYDELAKVENENNVSISIPEIVGTVEETVEKIQALSTATEENMDEAYLEIVTHLRDNVIDSDWGYEVMKEVMKSAATELDGEGEVILDSFMELSEEEYKESGIALLNLAEYALKNNVRDGNIAALQTTEFYELAAESLNASDMTVKVKEYLISEMIATANGVDSTAADKLLASYDDSVLKDNADLQKQEIEALMNLTTAESVDDVKAALKKVPTLDKNVIDEVFSNIKSGN